DERAVLPDLGDHARADGALLRIGADDAIDDDERSSRCNRVFPRLEYAHEIVGMHQGDHQLRARLHTRIEAEYPVVLLRPGHLPTEEIELEAADVRDSLCLGQAPLTRL